MERTDVVAPGRAVFAQRLGGQIIAGAAKVARTTAAWVAMVDEFDEREGYLHFEQPSTAKWLEFACSMSSEAAREHVRVAQALRGMPKTAAAFAAGEVSFSKVRAISRIAGLIDEEVALENAQNLTANQLERAVRGYRNGRVSRLEAEAARRVTIREGSDGLVQVTAWLAPEEAALISNALEVAATRHRTLVQSTRAEDPALDILLQEAWETPAAVGGGKSETEAADARRRELARAEAADENPQIPAYTRADAFVDIARGYLDAGPADVSGEDRDLVVVHITAADLTAAHAHTARTGTAQAPPDIDQPDAGATDPSDAELNRRQTRGSEFSGSVSGRSESSGWRVIEGGRGVSAETSATNAGGDLRRAPGRAWIEGAGTIDPSTAERIGCTGLVQAILIDDDDEVLHLGRTQRFASKAQKRALKARDHHCQFPGCLRTARLHAHHLIPWSLGGDTNVDSMLLLCQHHHVITHAANLRITRERDKTTGRRTFHFYRPSGAEIRAQYPYQHSHPAGNDPDHRNGPDRALIHTLTQETAANAAAEQARTEQATADRDNRGDGRGDVSAETSHATELPDTRQQLDDWELPEDMREYSDVADLWDPRATLFPRFGGARATRSDLYELMEYRAATPRTNHHATY